MYDLDAAWFLGRLARLRGEPDTPPEGSAEAREVWRAGWAWEGGDTRRRTARERA